MGKGTEESLVSRNNVSAQIDFILDPLESLLDFGGQVLKTILLQPSRKRVDLQLCSFAEPLLQLLKAGVPIG